MGQMGQAVFFQIHQLDVGVMIKIWIYGISRYFLIGIYHPPANLDLETIDSPWQGLCNEDIYVG